MGYRVRYKLSGRNYLSSPLRFAGHGGASDPCEPWSWSPSADRAHVFATRAEAKSTLRELRQGRDFKLTDFTFEKVN